MDKAITPDAIWIQQKSDALTTYGKQHNETEIAVIPEIAELVIGHTVAEPATYPAF